MPDPEKPAGGSGSHSRQKFAMGEDFDPKGKGYLLGTHILDKGFQAGSLVGLLAVCPLTAFRSTRRGDLDVFRRAVKACGTSAAVGTVLAGTAC